MPNPQDRISFGTTSRGNKTLIHQDFEYVKILQKPPRSGKVYWRCRLFNKHKCPAYVVLDNTGKVSTLKDHNHDVDKEALYARQAVAAMKQKVLTESMQACDAYRTICKQLKPSVIAKLPGRDQLLATLTRHRRIAMKKMQEPNATDPTGDATASKNNCRTTVPKKKYVEKSFSFNSSGSDDEEDAMEQDFDDDEVLTAFLRSTMAYFDEQAACRGKPIKRMSYPAELKLKIVQLAKKRGNRAAARELGISDRQVRDWRKNEQILKKMPLRKRANRGKVSTKTVHLGADILECIVQEQEPPPPAEEPNLTAYAGDKAHDSPNNLELLTHLALIFGLATYRENVRLKKICRKFHSQPNHMVPQHHHHHPYHHHHQQQQEMAMMLDGQMAPPLPMHHPMPEPPPEHREWEELKSNDGILYETARFLVRHNSEIDLNGTNEEAINQDAGRVLRELKEASQNHIGTLLADQAGLLMNLDNLKRNLNVLS